MDFEPGNGSSKHLTHFEVDINEVEPLTQSEDSFSSSSSDSSGKHIVLGQNVLRSPLSNRMQAEIESRRPISSPDMNPFVSSQSGSATQSPQNHLMGQPAYDPNRIPSSIFAGKPSTPMEWSVASNESLFSIQIGNGSFSRDNVFMLYKSGELSKFNDLINFPVPNSLPTVTESENMDRKSENVVDSAKTEVPPENMDRKSEKVEKSSLEMEVSIDKKMKVLVETEKDNSEGELIPPKEIHNSPRISDHSDGNNNSTRSFAFPVLKGNDGLNSSVKEKMDMDKQQSSKQSPKQPQGQSQELQPQTPKAAGSGWFSCFYCCSFCC